MWDFIHLIFLIVLLQYILFNSLRNIVLKKLFLVILSIFLVLGSTQAQKKRVQNLQQVDFKLIHFGFTLGLNEQEFNMEPSGVKDENGVVWYGDVVNPSPGFTVGIISDLRLNEYLNLRFVPTLNFGDRSITFSGMKNNQKVDEFNTTVISAIVYTPVYLKYRSLRLNNYRPYLLIGGGPMVDVSRKTDLTILLKPMDLFLEFGIGCDNYLPYFKFAPELKCCIGFNDMLERDRPMIANENELKYTKAISRLTSRLFILTFNFE